jgi:hypothetical protein
MSTPSLYIVLLTLTNAALTGSIEITLHWIRAAHFDQAWKYAAAGLFLLMTAALFAFAIRKLRVKFLLAFIPLSAFFNVTLVNLMAIGSGPNSLGKDIEPFSTVHAFMYVLQLLFSTFSYALLMGIMIVVLVSSKIPVASARLPIDLGMDAPAKELRQ